MWWAVTALTTVGYGDIYPQTPWGRIIGAATAIVGIGFFAVSYTHLTLPTILLV